VGGVGDPGSSALAGGTVPAQRERPAAAAAPRGDGPAADIDLVVRMRSGDDTAYEELYRRHADAVRRYARNCCRDAHTADDLTAEVFARMLQAVRGGSGPEHAVRAYLLTSVRRVAAGWTRSAKREQLVDDFAVFAAQAARSSEVSDDDRLDVGADVRAMHEAEQSMAMRAFRSLPERWQAVLWHTEVEDESPSEVATLFGLDANGTRVLASRAREGLKQAYLQAHVSAALTGDGECARYADQLGGYARRRLRSRAERGLRKHLEECARCRVAALQIEEVAGGIPAVVPIAVIGWFGVAGYGRALGIIAGGAGVGAAGVGVGVGAGAGAGGGVGVSAGAGAGVSAGAGAGVGTGVVPGAGAGVGAGVSAGVGVSIGVGGGAGAGAGFWAGGGGVAGVCAGGGGAGAGGGASRAEVKAGIAAGVVAVAAAAAAAFALVGDGMSVAGQGGGGGPVAQRAESGESGGVVGGVAESGGGSEVEAPAVLSADAPADALAGGQAVGPVDGPAVHPAVARASVGGSASGEAPVEAGTGGSAVAGALAPVAAGGGSRGAGVERLGEVSLGVEADVVGLEVRMSERVGVGVLWSSGE
jgi:RNA polymerase sigma factor (sigma-70 family)